jgi:hypothetical protein
MTWTHQLTVFAYHFNLVGQNTNSLKENTEFLLDASSKISLEENAEKIKYMSCLISRLQNR